MTIYNCTKLCDSPLSISREMEVRRGRARQGRKETVREGEKGAGGRKEGGGRVPHLHTFLRDITRHCGRWNKALSSVLFPFVVQVRGSTRMSAIVGRLVIVAGNELMLAGAQWSQWKPINQKSPVPMQHSKTSAAVKHSKLSDVSCAINHSLMDVPY